mgnify:CR=1 FL=1
MDLSQFDSLNLPIDTLVSLSLYFVLAFYAVFTAIFYYHWNTYGTDKQVTSLTFVIYFATTIPLLVVMTIISLII